MKQADRMNPTNELDAVLTIEDDERKLLRILANLAENATSLLGTEAVLSMMDIVTTFHDDQSITEHEYWCDSDLSKWHEVFTLLESLGGEGFIRATYHYNGPIPYGGMQCSMLFLGGMVLVNFTEAGRRELLPVPEP